MVHGSLTHLGIIIHGSLTYQRTIILSTLTQKIADSSFRVGTVCPYPCRHICSHSFKIGVLRDHQCTLGLIWAASGHDVKWHPMIPNDITWFPMSSHDALLHHMMSRDIMSYVKLGCRAERVVLFRLPFRGSIESSVSEFSSIGKCRTIIYYFGIQE